MSRCFSGGEGDRPSSSHFRPALRRGRGQAPLPHNVGTFDNYLSAVQCRLFVDKIELGYLLSGTLRRYHQSGSEWGCCTDEALRRHHGPVGCLAICTPVQVRYRSGRSAMPCGGYAGLFVADRAELPAGGDAIGDTFRLGRSVPWFVLGTSRCEVLHLFSGMHQVHRCWSETGWGMFEFRPGCLAVYLARIKGCESSSVLLSHVITQRAAPHQCKIRSVLSSWAEGAPHDQETARACGRPHHQTNPAHHLEGVIRARNRLEDVGFQRPQDGKRWLMWVPP